MEQLTISKVLDTSAGELLLQNIPKKNFMVFNSLQIVLLIKRYLNTVNQIRIIFYDSIKKNVKIIIYLKYQKGTTIQEIISKPEAKEQEKKWRRQINIYHNYCNLYQLHKQNILGRVFSTSNLLDCGEDGIFMMDLGFGPAFQQNDIENLAPPYIIYQLCSQKEQQVKSGNSALLDSCDLKIDSWPLGAFLFHMARQVPTCSHKIQAKNSEN